MYFKSNPADEPQYLNVNDLEGAIDSVEIFGNRWSIYDLETLTDKGWAPYKDRCGDGLRELMKNANDKNLIHRMTVDTGTYSMVADGFYFKRHENRQTYDMVRLDFIEEKLGLVEFGRLFGDIGYRNDMEE